MQWKSEGDDLYEQVKEHISERAIESAYTLAEKSMSTLNKNAAGLIKKYKSNGCTDVTGFGILGHLENLAEAQKSKGLRMELTNLPIIEGMTDVEKTMNFKLTEGYSAETSGGLMLFIDPKAAPEFQAELKTLGQDSWTIGQVVASSQNDQNEALVVPGCEITSVTSMG